MDVDNQAFLMMTMLDTNLIGNATDQARYSFGVPRGAQATLNVRVTIEVSYYDASAGRRRRRLASRQQGSIGGGRRQADTHNSASLSLAPQSIVPFGDDVEDDSASSSIRAHAPSGLIACVAGLIASAVIMAA
jgi:hypothetical protein